MTDKLYRTIVENAIELISLISLEGKVIYASPSHTTVLGYTPQELVGAVYENFVHPDDLKLARSTLEKSMLQEKSPLVTVRMKNKNGSEVYIEGSATTIYDKQRKPTMILAISRDVTELRLKTDQVKKSEQRYHHLVDVSPEAIAVHSQGTLVYVNQAGAALIGAKRPEDIIGRPVLDFVHPDYHKLVIDRMKKIYEEGKHTDLVEERFIRLDGSVVDVEVISIPFIYQDKQSVQVVIRDITERKKVEKQRDDFLAIASHELKTPITTIKGFAQLLQRYFRQIDDQRAISYLSKMDNQLNNLTSLIQDLLDVSKMQTGKMEYNMEYFNIDELLHEIVDDTELTTPHHRITTAGSYGSMVYGDKYRLAQVLINLLSNAVKYTPKGGDISVALSADARELTISVKDQGIGIPEDKKEKIFNRFYRIYDKQHESYAGLGLGLYISGEIIRRHGGRLWVDSTLNVGSTFSFTLPVTRKPSRRKRSA